MSKPSRRPHPAIIEAREVIALEQEREDVTLRRVYRAIMLTDDLTVCRALLNGEQVPLSRLDQRTIRRYGLRTQPCSHCGATPARVTLDDINHVSEMWAA